MSQFQLPPLKNAEQFEAFVCDLFNKIENTDTYNNTDFQAFGVRGQNQKGIDIFSTRTKTVIQCKVKDIRKTDDFIRTSLLSDLDKDLYNAFQLSFDFDRFLLVSTFRDDAIIQEKTTKITTDIAGSVKIYYWGWDTLMKYTEQYPELLQKYFPKFMPQVPKRTQKEVIKFPEGALGNDLARKNHIAHLKDRYREFKEIQFKFEGKGEKFNYGRFNKEINNRYKAAGINFIPIIYFDDLVKFLEEKIDRTIIGKKNKIAGYKNYSKFGGL